MDAVEEFVSLRSLVFQDAEVLAGWAADAQFCREAGWSIDLSFSEHQRFHRALIASPPADLIRLGAVHEGLLVGYVDLHGNDAHRRELGFVMGERTRWGRGLGRSSAAAGLDYGFGHLRLQEVWAEALDANRRSVKILQRLGMVETDRGGDALFLGRPTYFRQFTIRAEDWRERSSALNKPR